MTDDVEHRHCRTLLTRRRLLDAVAGARAILGEGATGGPDESVLATIRPELRELLIGEYGGPPLPGPGVAGAHSRKAAALRHDVRRRLPRHPATLLTMLTQPEYRCLLDSPARTAVADAFALCADNSTSMAATAIRAALSRADQGLLAFLFDLADQHGLDVAKAVELAELVDSDRVARHAAWRYLSGRPGDPGARALLVKHRSRTADRYEQLLLTAALHRLGANPSATHPLWPEPVAPPAGPGCTVAQPMLLGLPDRPGAGASGGLGVLLLSLGDALTEVDSVARVVTIVLCPSTRLATLGTLVAPASPGDEREHLILRIPVDAAAPPRLEGMAQHRSALRWWTTALLTATGLTPGVTHLRFADDGALAVAEAASAGGSKLVFTATADPHRAIAARYAHDPDEIDHDALDHDALDVDLHRMYVGDRLIELADQVVAIPGRRGDDELETYLPQLRPDGVSRPVLPIEEGITSYRGVPADEPARRQLVASLFAPHAVLPRLGDPARGLPVLLCVGRLHPVKQQDLLVEAWLSAKLPDHCSLVLIGGALDEPDDDEARILSRILGLAAAHPAAAGSLAVIPALSNAGVRMLEHGIQHFLPASSPHLYVCPSAKEEFGIAVLEAMDAGYLIGGPRRGGLGHYIRDGHNGFLLDTTSAATLAPALGDFVLRSGRAPAEHRAIAEAGRETVRQRFGIRQVAAKFAGVYARLAADTAGGSS
ncbi:glycosyltransferase family 4 protein [Amycolatopsis sp. H20-H5]|uniref:glycosyltransferase family 4 protein n=1 Tax=Amycolatopsis sp. H20-H5 TaxID=3046309 RepID=UPI002DB9A137|nr:glycosyltransferase family 4 protein [Amycolatopsis sp. H20-H5]MEC3976411.1 glycosyltransferase family 4 protein [Amycolatopsis sp. H20-H5]